ncbi:MAG: hypothetical protein M3Z66_05395 [Chloroflexota bacterium]|nr:hypothetical protein [Chloroflexota bacterium]
MTTVLEPTVRRRSPVRWDRPVRLTPLYHEHLVQGADMEERDGWLLPRSYGDPDGELRTLRDSAGLFDISEQGKIDLKGEEIVSVLRAVFPAMESAEIGTRAGGMDGALVYRLTNEQALVLTAPAAAQDTLETLRGAAAKRRCVHLTDITGSLCGLRLLGPQAPAVLERLSTLDLAVDRFPDGAFAQGALAKIHALVARRDAAGLAGYDLYLDRDLAAYLWGVLLEAGTPLGLRPVGREAEEGSG